MYQQETLIFSKSFMYLTLQNYEKIFKTHYSPQKQTPFFSYTKRQIHTRLLSLFVQFVKFVFIDEKLVPVFDFFPLPSSFSNILINPFILFYQFEQSVKQTYPLWFHLPRIHHLPIRFHPIEHIMLLNPMLRWIPVVGLNETNHLLVSLKPSCFLIHNP